MLRKLARTSVRLWNTPREHAPWFLRIVAALLIFLPWRLGYMALSLMPEPAGAVVLRFDFEHHMPRPAFTTWVYAITPVFVCLSPLFMSRIADLKRFAIAGWMATVIGLATYLLAPTRAAFLPMAHADLTGATLEAMRRFDAEWLAFPSFHATWSMLAAYAYSSRWPRLWILWFGFAGMIGATCLTTGSHALADVLAGFLLATGMWVFAGSLRHLRRAERFKSHESLLRTIFGFVRLPRGQKPS